MINNRGVQENGSPKNSRIPLLVIAGPTAVGKTALSFKLAKELNGEIVSADSVQVYRYLDTGSDKPSLEQRKEVPHHMVDVVDPDVNFTVYDFQQMAKRCIEDIYSRGKLPLLTGGTGLYINALVDEYKLNSSRPDPSLRKQLKEELNTKGKEYLYNKLQKIDPQSADKIHPNDTRRIIRALEYYYLTGKPISSQKNLTQEKRSPYFLNYIGLNMERKKLHERINNRVDAMIQKGLLEEVKGILKKGYTPDLKSLQSLGYKHMIAYLYGNCDWYEAVNLFKRDTRRYAKRQITWFSADKRIKWFELTDAQEIDNVLENIYINLAGK